MPEGDTGAGLCCGTKQGQEQSSFAEPTKPELTKNAPSLSWAVIRPIISKASFYSLRKSDPSCSLGADPRPGQRTTLCNSWRAARRIQTACRSPGPILGTEGWGWRGGTRPHLLSGDAHSHSASGIGGWALAARTMVSNLEGARSLQVASAECLALGVEVSAGDRFPGSCVPRTTVNSWAGTLPSRFQISNILAGLIEGFPEEPF